MDASKALWGWALASGAALFPLLVAWGAKKYFKLDWEVTAHGELFLVACALSAAAIADLFMGDFMLGPRYLLGGLAALLFTFGFVLYGFVFVGSELKGADTDHEWVFSAGLGWVIGSVVLGLAARIVGAVRW